MTCPLRGRPPIPLKVKADSSLVKLIKRDGNNEAFLEVCRRYENIFFKICQRYTGALYRSGINPKDIFSEKDYLIFHCIRSYDPKKRTKLGTWIGNYARYLCLNSINSRKFEVPQCDEETMKFLEDEQSMSAYLHSSDQRKEDSLYLVHLLDQMKDKRISAIFKMRYWNKKVTWADIAKALHLSTQTVINLHSRGLRILSNKFQSKVISDKL